MKRGFLFVVFFIVYFHLAAQITGNGNITTIVRSFDSIESVSVNINGSVEIVCGSEESKVEITYDENIVDLVGTTMESGTLVIDQKKWIQGTKEVHIKIFTDTLFQLHNDSWSSISVRNVNQNKLEVQSSISVISLFGQVDELKLISESSDIKAYDLEVKNADITVTEDGRIYINVSESLSVNASENARVEYKGKPSKVQGLAKSGSQIVDRPQIDTKWIDVTFKNNSLHKIHAYVRGPKPNGKYFSYGLNFFPMAKKAERWTIGTKLFKVNKLGFKTLLHEVTAEDEGRVVKIMGKK